MNITHLSAPLSGDPDANSAALCGPDMVFSVEFDALQELRREDDASLSQGEWVTDVKKADWPRMLGQCEALLATRTKDLRLAAWLAEASMHVNGFAGLADGLDLYSALCRDLWGSVHPVPEDADMELRVGSINWLLTLVKQSARGVTLLGAGEQSLTLADIELARQRSKLPTAPDAPPPPARPDGRPSVVTMDWVTKAQRATPPARVLAAVEGARRLPGALAQLQTVMDERLGEDSPGFASAREAVAAVLAGVERVGREMGVISAQAVAVAPSSDAVGVGSAGADDSAAATVGAALGTPTSRVHAIAQLRQVAEFFRRTEPHSPVAYLAERAAHWGEMPLHEWLRAVLKEQGALTQLEELLGVLPPPEPPQ